MTSHLKSLNTKQITAYTYGNPEVLVLNMQKMSSPITYQICMFMQHKVGVVREAG
jgi:hypothetical protein